MGSNSEGRHRYTPLFGTPAPLYRFSVRLNLRFDDGQPVSSRWGSCRRREGVAGLRTCQPPSSRLLPSYAPTRVPCSHPLNPNHSRLKQPFPALAGWVPWSLCTCGGLVHILAIRGNVFHMCWVCGARSCARCARTQIVCSSTSLLAFIPGQYAADIPPHQRRQTVCGLGCEL